MRIAYKLYPHSFSDVRALSIAESHHSVFEVRVARIKSTGCERIGGFFYIYFTAPANRKKDAPLRALGGGIVTLAGTQLSTLGEKSIFCLSG